MLYLYIKSVAISIRDFLKTSQFGRRRDVPKVLTLIFVRVPQTYRIRTWLLFSLFSDKTKIKNKTKICYRRMLCYSQQHNYLRLRHNSAQDTYISVVDINTTLEFISHFRRRILYYYNIITVILVDDFKFLLRFTHLFTYSWRLYILYYRSEMKLSPSAYTAMTPHYYIIWCT